MIQITFTAKIVIFVSIFDIVGGAFFEHSDNTQQQKVKRITEKRQTKVSNTLDVNVSSTSFAVHQFNGLLVIKYIFGKIRCRWMGANKYKPKIDII